VEDEVDPLLRLELETEGKLWLQIALTEDTLDELRKKAKDHLNGRGTG
jgi:hypothetical protein